VEVLQGVHDAEAGTRVQVQGGVADGGKIDQNGLPWLCCSETAVLTARVVAPLSPLALMIVNHAGACRAACLAAQQPSTA